MTLSRTDYDRLLDLASRKPRPPDGAPLPAALTRAEIRVRVAAGTVRATMTVDGEVFQTGTVKVPLISNATLLDARIGDRPLPLVAEGNAHVAVVVRSGDVLRDARVGIRGHDDAGTRGVRPAGPPAGSATATFDVPGEQSDLRVSPGLVLRRTSAGGRTIVEAALDPGHADAGLVVVARNRADRRAARRADARRREDARHDRRGRRAAAVARGRDDRAGGTGRRSRSRCPPATSSPA